MASEKSGPAVLMEAFFDAGAYTPMLEANGGVAAGFGMAGGQGAYAVCQKGEALSAADVKVCRRVLKLAAETGNPVVTFYNAPGAKLDDGLQALAAAQKLVRAAAKLSGVCGATSAMAAANADLLVMTKDAELFLSPPFLSAAGGDKTPGAGGADAAVKAGVAAIVVDSAEDAARKAAKLVAMLPQNNLAETPAFEYAAPAAPYPAPYTGAGAVEALADAGSAIELFAGFGGGITTWLATLAGNVVGLVATAGPSSNVGPHCAARAARFVRLCDAYSIPLVTVLDSGGFVVSSTADEAGLIREAPRLAATYADATCARVAVLSGRSFGPLYAALAGADLTVAMRGSVTAPVEPRAAVTVLEKAEIEASGKPIDAETAQRAQRYEQEVASADALLKAGLAEFVADAATLRGTVEAALDILASKRAQRMPKKHGNMPL